MLPVYLTIAVVSAFMVAAWALQRARRSAGTLHSKHFALPNGWLEILRKNVPLYNRMPVDLRERMQDAVLNFVDGKRWKHCGGLEAVTAEMKVTIAGQACFLMLARVGQPNFAKVHNVLVYPKSALSAPPGSENAIPPEEEWPALSVLLAWDDERRTAVDIRDESPGQVREFAARLGAETAGASAGSGNKWLHTPWARALTGQFLKIEEQSRRPESLVATHGESGAAEYFAAATELFFEKPDRLNSRHPDLYARLRSFFKLDPVKWHPAR